MGYAVLHLDKASGNEAKMTAHIERTQMPANAGLNRKIGTNQVRAIRIMLTGSNAEMKRIEAEGTIKE